MRQASINLNQRAKNLPSRIERIFAIYVSNIGEELVPKTPVATGRARGNWIPSIGGPALHSTVQTDPNAVLQPSKIALLALRWKIGQTFHITNNLTYVKEDLIEGSSSQAPANFHIQAVLFGIIHARQELARVGFDE